MRWHSYADARFFEGFCLGLTIFSVLLSAFVLVQVGWGDAFGRLENYFFGTVAIAGAFFTVRAVNKQIRQQIEQEEERKSRNFLRLRSTSLLELSYIERKIADVLRWYENPTLAFDIDLDEVERKLVKISELIEFAPPTEAQSLATYVAVFQVLKIRTLENVRRYSGKTNARVAVDLAFDEARILSEYINWAAYHTLTSSLFPLLRGEKGERDYFSLSHEKIERALDWYYVVPGEAGDVPKSVGKAKQLLNQRRSGQRLLPNFWTDLGVVVLN